MSEPLLRLAPVALPIGGSVLGILFESIFRRPWIATAFAVAGLAGAILTSLGGAAGLPGYGSHLFGLDGRGALLTAAAACFALLTLGLSDRYLPAEEEEFPAERSALLVLVPAGIAMVVGARHLMVVFLGIELLSVPLYALAALRRGKARSVEGAVKYFLLGAFAAGFLAYGMALLYASEYTLELEKLRGAAVKSTAAALGTGFVIAGLLFKISAAPFHFWTPDVYEGSATPVTALMASSTKIAATVGLLLTAPLLSPALWPLLAAASILSIAAGNLAALAQSNVKRLLAYSSVAHAGTVLLAITAQVAASASPSASEVATSASEAAVFYLAGYGFSVLGAFGVLAILERGGSRFGSIADFRGLSRRQPLAAGLLLLFLLSLAGIPPTAGFWAKYLAFAALIRADLVALAVGGIVLSVLGAAYYLRWIAICFMASEEESPGTPPQGRGPFVAWLAVGAASAGVAVLGLAPSLLLGALPR